MSATTHVESAKAWGGGHRSPYGISYGKMMMWFFLLSDALTFTGFLTAYGFMRHKYQDIWPVAGDVFTHFPFIEGHIELAYVGLMTFILIMSSVTMVLAVEAGHRMDKNGVIKWMIFTIIGGFIFLGSQAYEWYHFIHGTEHGAYVTPMGEVFHIVKADEHGHAQMLKEWEPDAAIKPATVRLYQGWQENPGLIKGAEAEKMLAEARWIQGANLKENEYGHPLFGDFFFFITGFHGFHVFSGVVINIVILIGVMLGIYHKRGHYEMVEKTGLYWHFVDLVWVFVFTFFYLL
jgi:cytochrome c oxidase subunit 3